MCDTLVYRNGTATYFAKNSDREPSEPQRVVRLAPVRTDPSPTVRATWIEVPQTAHRHGVLLSKPDWLWGAEMGANDCGVVMGNEAVFTNVHDPTPGLIGMDLLRLGLERGDTALHALHVITEHLEKYGQGGRCGFRDAGFTYDNSFIIADAADAWVLETAGRHWAAKRVTTSAAISNRLTIGYDFDLRSVGLEDFAWQEGLYNRKGDFHFAKTFQAPLITFFSGSKHRLAAGQSCLAALDAGDTVPALMRHLRSHRHPSPEARYRTNGDVCMHAAGFIRRSQTTGSMVAELSATGNHFFFTGTSAPCLSLFKPASFNFDLPFLVLNRAGDPVEETCWHWHEQIHRRLLLDSTDRDELLRDRDETEEKVLQASPPEADVMARDWQERWAHRFMQRPFRYQPLRRYHRYWRKLNGLDGFPGSCTSRTSVTSLREPQ